MRRNREKGPRRLAVIHVRVDPRQSPRRRGGVAVDRNPRIFRGTFAALKFDGPFFIRFSLVRGGGAPRNRGFSHDHVGMRRSGSAKKMADLGSSTVSLRHDTYRGDLWITGSPGGRFLTRSPPLWSYKIERRAFGSATAKLFAVISILEAPVSSIIRELRVRTSSRDPRVQTDPATGGQTLTTVTSPKPTTLAILHLRSSHSPLQNLQTSIQPLRITTDPGVAGAQ